MLFILPKSTNPAAAMRCGDGEIQRARRREFLDEVRSCAAKGAPPVIDADIASSSSAKPQCRQLLSAEPVWLCEPLLRSRWRPVCGSEGRQRQARALGCSGRPAGGLMTRVLIAEDERDLADALATGLRRHGHRVSVAYDGAEAREKLHQAEFDVVILDRGLPLISGDVVCEEMVANAIGARVIMVTAAGGVADRVGGLRIGADDYLPKPFAFEELAARVEALARRPAVRREPNVAVVADLTIDKARRTVERAGRSIDLTVKEFGVLEVLASAPECWTSAEDLLEQVWDRNTDPFTSAVKVTVSTLRRKLGEPQLIETLRGVGYRLRSRTTEELS